MSFGTRRSQPIVFYAYWDAGSKIPTTSSSMRRWRISRRTISTTILTIRLFYIVKT